MTRTHYQAEPPQPGPVTGSMVSVVLPTYNEAGNIVPLMERILAAVGPEVEIIVVDDDSPDGTGGVVRDFGVEHPQARLISRTTERGLTSAIYRGVTESSREAVVWMDCDLAMPPEDIPRLLDALENRHAAVGSRYASGGRGEGNPLLNRMLSRTICLMTQLLLPGKLTDYTSGFIAARRTVVTGLGLRGDYGEYCIDFLVRASKAGCAMIEVPYVFGDRFCGESKTGVGIKALAKRGYKYLFTLAKLMAGR